MTLNEVQDLFVALKKKYGIKGWRLLIEDMPGFRGCCDYDNRLISLSPNLLVRKEIEIVSVMLHEFAHLLVRNEKNDHGPLWNNKLAELIADFSFVGA